MTPLMLAAARNKPTICKLLLGAGANADLLDPSGKTALKLAVEAGAGASASVLDAVHSLPSSFPPSDILLDSWSDPVAEFHEAAEKPAPGIEAQSSGSEATQLAAIGEELDEHEFDLSGWEAEEELMPPKVDPTVLGAASAVQAAITAHEPLDFSAEWDDIDTYLPEVALPLVRADNTEGREQLRRLLLRAIREGSVPRLDVQVRSINEDRSDNPAAESYLSMIINDLGAEVDERFEYSTAGESFEVFVDLEETLDEEATLDEAFAAIDRAGSPHQTPLSIYQREFQRLALLTAEDEIQLGKDMEAAIDDALDALASWPEGLSRTLAAGAEAIAGLRQISSIWIGRAESDLELVSAESLEAPERLVDEPENTIDEVVDSLDEGAVDTGGDTFADALRRLKTLVEEIVVSNTSFYDIRQALVSLRLNRRFLLELIDDTHRSASDLAFQRAMARLRKARDRMTAANLKLAFFHAKKFMYSGEPLDDLAQEGNIGLLKAVDRYDWRRGFRFSTYATWWIRQQIGRYVADRVRTIRIPVHAFEKIQRMERMIQTFESAAGREPTADELAERMEMSLHKLMTLQRIAQNVSCIDEHSVDELAAIDTYSLPDPEDIVSNIQRNRAVDRFVSSLSTKDRKQEWVLRMRFGIGVNQMSTLDEIGTLFGVTRERIRQIESKAIKALRHSARSEPFARLVLGLRPGEHCVVPGAQEPTEVDGSCGDEAVPLRNPIRRVASSKPTALERVLAQATQLGVSVEDGRETALGRVWVDLRTVPDKQHRMLARNLIELGFQHWPGKGYWL